MDNLKILLVEDEEDIRNLVTLQLTRQGYRVETCDNGDLAIERLQAETFDLFIIDRMLPGTPGLDICKFIRRYHPTKFRPVLIFTALGRPNDIVEGLEAGADDYVTKPFDLDVLMARVNSLSRRSQVATSLNDPALNSKIYVIGKMRIDADQCKIWINESEVLLTASEYKLLIYLVENSRKVLSRGELVSYIQGDEVHVTERTIDTHIFGLRKKLASESHLIETIRGIGYRVNTDR